MNKAKPGKVFLNRWLLKLLIIPLLLVSGCSREVPDAGVENPKVKEKPDVTVSILPQRYFVSRITGDKYKINVMIPPGHSPATYEPTPREMKAVSRSILYFRIGHIGFENAWMEKIAALNKNMKIIDTSKGVSLIKSKPCSHDHDAEAHHHHHHAEGIDPHIWLSTTAAKVQAGHILNAFIEADPGNRAFYEKNYRAFMEDIRLLEAENKKVLQPLQGKKFMVYHPAWSYFAREYGLLQYPIEIEGKSPGAADLKKMMDIAERENIRVIFVQRQFTSDSARAIAEAIGGKVVKMDPLAPDWLQNMKKIAGTLKETLTGK